MNEVELEKAFITLYDDFLKLNLYVQNQYKKDEILKKQLRKISLVLEDLSEHYYWEEINRVREEIDGDTETH